MNRALVTGLLTLTALTASGCRSGRIIPIDRPMPAVERAERGAVIADSVVEHQLFPRSGATRSRYYRAIDIQSAAGLEAANVVISIEPQVKLVRFAARVTTPDGKIVDVGREVLERLEVSRIPGPARHVSYAYVASLPDVTIGSKLQISYTVHRPYLVGNHEELLSSHWPVRRAEVALSLPTWLKVEFRNRGFEPAATRGRLGGTRYAYVAEHVPPESGARHRGLAGRRLPFVQWRIQRADIGYGQTFNKDWAQATDPLREMLGADLARAATLNAPPLPADRLEAVRAAWQWVRSRVVPRSPTWLPGPRASTLDARMARGVGNRDEMARMALAALRQAGHDVVPVLVPGAGQLDVQDGFHTPTVQRFDVLVLIDREAGAYLDPYCDGCPVGVLAEAHQGRAGVELVPAHNRVPEYLGAKRHDTKRSSFMTGVASSWTHLTVGPEPTLVDEMGHTWHGFAAAWMNNLLFEHPHTAEWRAKHFKRVLFSAVAGGDVSVQCKARECTTRLAGGALLSPRVARTLDTVAVTLADVFPEGWMADYAPDRRTPVVFPTGRGFSNTLRVRAARGWRLARIPDTVVDSPFGRYMRTVKPADGGVEIRDVLLLEAERIEPKAYAQWRTFMAQVQDARRVPLLAHARPSGTPPAGPGAPRVEAPDAAPGPSPGGPR